MIAKTTDIKDWMLYREDGKTKAFNVTDHENTDELQELCSDNGICVIGFVAFEFEKDATNYGNYFK